MNSLSSTTSMALVVVASLLLSATTTPVSAFVFLPSVVGPRAASPLFLLPPDQSSSSSSASSSSSPYQHQGRHNAHPHNQQPEASTASQQKNKQEQDDRRLAEFMNLEPLPTNDKRRERMQQQEEIRSQFVEFGDDLWNLRSTMDQLNHKWVQALNDGKLETELATKRQLQELERKDPELVYLLELANLQDASREGRHDDAERHRARALKARSVLPQFNLDGLWVGKYGSHGYELINVTYEGDTLIATKVTGDRNVPKGELTFQCDLHPLRRDRPATSGISSSGNNNNKGRDSEKSIGYGVTRLAKQLQPIMLTEKAAKKWGTRKLPRYAGMGQVAEDGFRNHQWMDGQLIIIGDDYFSFAWIPIEQQIFFGRPSPELALKMLRDHSSSEMAAVGAPEFITPPSLDDDLELQKKYVMRCLTKTHEVEDERSLEHHNDAAFSCIWHDADSDQCYLE